MARKIMEREIFGDLVGQIVRHVKEDMLRNIVEIEGVHDLASAPFKPYLEPTNYPTPSEAHASSIHMADDQGPSPMVGLV